MESKPLPLRKILMGTGQKSQDLFPHYKYEVSDFIFFNCASEQVLDFFIFLIIEN